MFKKLMLIAITMLLLFGSWGCQKKIDIEANVEAIKSLTEEFDATFNAGDLDGNVSLYTDDVVYMPPNMPALVGKDALRDFFKSIFDQYTAIEHVNTTEEVIVCGDWVFARGTYTITLTPKVGGKPIRNIGKWVGFNKRQPDGSWKYYRVIYNSDLPPSGAQ